MIDFSASIDRIQSRYAYTQTWTVTRTSSVDAVRPWLEISRTSIVYTVSIITGKMVQSLAKEIEQINTLVKTSLSIVLFPGDYVPNMADTIIWNNEVHSIASINVFKPSNALLFYVVGLIR